MDEKTEELRDIFMDVADDETVTERQEETRGSLTEDEDAVDERLEEGVAEMRERYEFSTDLADSDLREVVRQFFEGSSDSVIADSLGVSRRVVFRARLDLHLLRDRDTDAPFDLATLRELLDEGLTVSAIADELDVSASTVLRYRRVVTAQDEARAVSDRFRSEFEGIMTDAGIATRMTPDIREDGLEEATEGMDAESDVSL